MNSLTLTPEEEAEHNAQDACGYSLTPLGDFVMRRLRKRDKVLQTELATDDVPLMITSEEYEVLRRYFKTVREIAGYAPPHNPVSVFGRRLCIIYEVHHD